MIKKYKIYDYNNYFYDCGITIASAGKNGKFVLYKFSDNSVIKIYNGKIEDAFVKVKDMKNKNILMIPYYQNAFLENYKEYLNKVNKYLDMVNDSLTQIYLYDESIYKEYEKKIKILTETMSNYNIKFNEMGLSLFDYCNRLIDKVNLIEYYKETVLHKRKVNIEDFKLEKYIDNELVDIMFTYLMIQHVIHCKKPLTKRVLQIFLRKVECKK